LYIDLSKQNGWNVGDYNNGLQIAHDSHIILVDPELHKTKVL